MNDKLKNLFEDLGKPTLRGIRKCPKCGTYNGTRGLSCKNKACDVIFKDTKEKKKTSSVDVVKVITGTSASVCSIKLKYANSRGFVLLPTLQLLSDADESSSNTLITQKSPECFVETCRNPSSRKILTVDSCEHIQAAVECYKEAKPLTLKNSILNSLPISNEIKQEIWSLATESTGPLVQRVSKHTMVVKCKQSNKHSLGLLHFAFFGAIRRNQSVKYRIQCECQKTKVSRTGSFKETHVKCIHFYACLCAFASDEKLTAEFRNYVYSDISALLEKTLLNNFGIQDCVNDVMSDHLLTNARETSQTEKNFPQRKRRKNDDLASMLVDESTSVFSFEQWLTSVTEKINQTMHFQFSGYPDPLVFHAPQVFFNCLQQRISAGYKKKRLPNATTTFVRKDALPLGTFSKYTWHITNILHVKQIFDTPRIPLDVTRSFIENYDGTFDFYEPIMDDVKGIAQSIKKTINSPLIKPLELKTFLKVGNMTPNQTEPTPFVIEWIPNILPKSHIGELRITFEYGHQKNGSFENQLSHLNNSCKE